MSTGWMIASALLVALAACSGGQDAENTTEPTTTSTSAESNPAAIPLADLTGDAAAGERIFAQCQSCHTIEPGMNRTGPSLAGLIGREAGSLQGFAYSKAMTNAGFAWTPEKLYSYLEHPQQTVPGTRMIFAGLVDSQDRADVIAYLEQHTD